MLMMACSYRLGRWVARQQKRERGTLAQAFTFYPNVSSKLAHGQRAAVQAEAVAIVARGESVLENAREVLRRDADTVVADLNSHMAVAIPADPQRHQSVGPSRVIQRVFGIADEVDQSLQNSVFVGDDRRGFLELAAYLDGVPNQRGPVDVERVFHQLRGAHALRDTGDFGVALLHGDNLLDRSEERRVGKECRSRW